MFAMTDSFTIKYDKYILNQKEKLAKLCLKYKPKQILQKKNIETQKESCGKPTIV